MNIRFILMVVSLSVFSAATARHRSTSNFDFTIGYLYDVQHSEITKRAPGVPMGAFQYEKKIGRFGVGIIAAFGQFRGYNSPQSPSTRLGDIYMGGFRGNAYLIQNDKLDVYLGIMVAYHENTGLYMTRTYTGLRYPYDYECSDFAQNPKWRFGAQLGAHLWLSRNFAFMGELSYGATLFNLGIALRK